jgi:hypothetical protein
VSNEKLYVIAYAIPVYSSRTFFGDATNRPKERQTPILGGESAFVYAESFEV